MDNKIENHMTVSPNIPHEILVELVKDVQNDGGLHNGTVFNSWKKRNNLEHIKIKDVSPLFQIDLDADPEESVNKLI